MLSISEFTKIIFSQYDENGWDGRSVCFILPEYEIERYIRIIYRLYLRNEMLNRIEDISEYEDCDKRCCWTCGFLDTQYNEEKDNFFHRCRKPGVEIPTHIVDVNTCDSYKSGYRE